MRPNPTRQRKAAHRQRLALGRAVHQVNRIAGFNWRHPRERIRIHVPKTIRRHAKFLKRLLAR